MNIIAKYKEKVATITLGLIVTGCGTTITPQVDVSSVAESLFTKELSFPSHYAAVHHSPVPEDAIGLSEFARFLAIQQKNKSSALIYLKIADMKSADDKLSVDALTAACIQFLKAGSRSDFVSTAEQLELIVNVMEYQIIGKQTQEILNLFWFFKSSGKPISASLRFLASPESDEFEINQ